MPTFSDVFQVTVIAGTASRLDGSLTVTPNMETGTKLFRADETGNFRIPFTYMRGRPPAVKAFRIEWAFGDGQTSGPITDASKRPTGSFTPAAPQWRHARTNIAVGPTEEMPAWFIGILPTIEGKYDGTITMEQP